MPFGDGTGPMGMGPMTGRAAGYCAGFAVPGYMNPYGRRGFWGRGGGRGFWGRGGGQGRGWRNWYYATGLPGWQREAYGYPAWGYGVGPIGYPAVPFEPAPEQELTALKQQAESMQNALEDINERIKELETEKPKEK